MIPDTSSWKDIGESDNARFFEIEPGVLAVIPTDGCTDDEETARQSVRTQLDYLRGEGVRAGTLVFMDAVAHQTGGARAVYRDDPDPAFLSCFALVGGTPFGRAVGSFFIGLSRPRVPTKMFSTYEEALTWARELQAKR